MAEIAAEVNKKSEAEIEYEKLISDELEETVRYAAAHGWKSTRHERGKELRAKIESEKNG